MILAVDPSIIDAAHSTVLQWLIPTSLLGQSGARDCSPLHFRRQPFILEPAVELIEYAHNSLTSCATGLSPFEASLGYQLPPFPEEERDLEVPSVQHHLQRAQWI